MTRARTHPTAEAVRCGPDRLSYSDLARAAGQLAGQLAGVGVGVDSRVALLAEQSAQAIVGLLGILHAGAAYVPIDPNQPDARVMEILSDARVAAVVVTAKTRSRLTGVAPPVVSVPEAPIADGQTTVRGTATKPTDPAYLIYTSGSHGEPKPVLVEHRQLVAATLARRMVYPDPKVFLLLSPLAFDSSVAGIWGTLTTGGCLLVATGDETRDVEQLTALIERHEVTTTLCVPSLYRALLDAAGRFGGDRLGSLRTVIVAGEALPDALAERHFAVLPSTTLVNEYGPTEATVWASFHRFTAPAPVTIGGPIPGARLYVLDADLRPLPAHAEGELFIGGTGVARGYFGRPEATSRAFLPDPFSEQPGARMYRTGDIVRWDGVGRLAFLGRRDDQVKIRGHRVELNAVATGLRGLAGVKDAVVLPDDENSSLLAFVAAAPSVTATAIRRAAAERMPPAMVPSRIHLLDGLPLTLNGKVDLRRLRQLAVAERRPAAAPALGDSLTTRVRAAWAEVLNVSEVPVDANFFDLGGHSVAIFSLQDALHRHAGVRPPMVALFQHPTVVAQAELIRGGKPELRGMAQ